jgi:hypothetical protein
MLRRDVLDDAGRPAWLLISQLAHARLAAELAAAWDFASHPLVEPRELFLETVRRHDDGWQVWEQRPEVYNGRPRDFMEMPLDESLAVWRRSIAVAGTIGPLAWVTVGGHFRRLTQMTLDKHEARHDWAPDTEHLAEDFLDEQDGHLREYLASFDPARRPEAEATASRSIRLLRLFDYMSLWLCCATQIDVETITGADGETYRFTPQGGAPESQAITVSPWPFVAPQLELSVGGRRIAAVAYGSNEALASAPSNEAEVRWRLVRS